MASTDTLTPTMAQSLLSIKNEFEPDQLLNVIDSAISNDRE